jgi:hypothetical protein
MSGRFKMNFNNYNTMIPRYNNNTVSASISYAPKQLTRPMPTSLRAPMIERVYKAKAGCSACGKKVA